MNGCPQCACRFVIDSHRVFNIYEYLTGYFCVEHVLFACLFHLRPIDAGGIHPGASSPHRRRAAEQMRRRRHRILQRKDAVAGAAANDGDGISAEKAKRRAVKASAIIEAALAAGEKDGDAILRMVDDRVTMERDAGVDDSVTDGDRDAAVTKDGADDAGLGADESLGMVSTSNAFIYV